MALLSSFGKQGTELNLLTKRVDIEDTEFLSKYFRLTDFNPIFTAGKNPIAFNGSDLLKNKSEIFIECLDSQGNSLYLEQAKSTENQFTDSSKFVVSIHVYDETFNGPGKLIISGTTRKGESVRWMGNITIDKTLNNSSKVRFYSKPTIEVRPLLYPVVDNSLAQTNYPPDPVVKVARAEASISSVVSNVVVNATGIGYTTANVEITGGGGSGAEATAVISGGKIVSITVTKGGKNYTSTPKVKITGDGSGATATAELSSQVIAITITDKGSGYTFVPSVNISGIGFGATAVATVVNGEVTEVTVTSGGNGYTKVPTISFELPEAPPPPDLNVEISFSGSFYTYAANPPKDTNKFTINTKQTDIDYRLVATSVTNEDTASTTFPYRAFNSQLEGREIILHINTIQIPFSTQSENVNITSSFTVKKVLNSKTILLNEPYYYTLGKTQIIAQILNGRFEIPYRFILYNTNPDSQKELEISPSQTVELKESYAEILYRNLRTYSGFIARHKLYRKSSFSPGDFQLISDELLEPIELLSDTVTFNKFYDRIGVFYHQPHIEKYWFPNSDVISLEAKTSPINSMRIYAGSFSDMDGTAHVIVKNDSIGITNDNVYYPYNQSEFNNLSGHSYNSNFISLKKDTLYHLSFDLIVEKESSDTTSNISFFFTSSISSIQTEKEYQSQFGWKLGSVDASEKTSIQYFTKRQSFFFTPSNDYYGTLVLVPYHCNVILSDVSLKVYGDHGFSPDILFVRIPFEIKVANEAFDIKAELLDINSNVVYSNLKTVQSFDPTGQSLYSSDSDITSVIQVTSGTSQNQVIITGTPYLPYLSYSTEDIRFVGWRLPNGEDTDGELFYTNVSKLFVSQSDYISLTSFEEGIETTAKSIAVRYDSSVPEGRKIFIDSSGNKEEFP